MNELPNIVITGPTASGKTALAVALCQKIGGEIISVDSRQVYNGMDIGTGKDLKAYGIGDSLIPCHLINIRAPGEKYNVFNFQEDAFRATANIRQRDKVPVFCGGTGLYLEAIMKSFAYTSVPVSDQLRQSLNEYSVTELRAKYHSRPPLPFEADLNSAKRLIRAIEIQQYVSNNPLPPMTAIPGEFCCFLMNITREERRRRISERLNERLHDGLVEEVQQLLERVSADDLMYYGLEYKYVTLYLTGAMDREEMLAKLETEIHRYAKRQMTWFRKMEKQGTSFRRIDGLLSIEAQLTEIIRQIY